MDCRRASGKRALRRRQGGHPKVRTSSAKLTPGRFAQLCTLHSLHRKKGDPNGEPSFAHWYVIQSALRFIILCYALSSTPFESLLRNVLRTVGFVKGKMRLELTVQADNHATTAAPNNQRCLGHFSAIQETVVPRAATDQESPDRNADIVPTANVVSASRLEIQLQESPSAPRTSLFPELQQTTPRACLQA